MFNYFCYLCNRISISYKEKSILVKQLFAS